MVCYTNKWTSQPQWAGRIKAHVMAFPILCGHHLALQFPGLLCQAGREEAIPDFKFLIMEVVPVIDAHESLTRISCVVGLNQLLVSWKT